MNEILAAMDTVKYVEIEKHAYTSYLYAALVSYLLLVYFHRCYAWEKSFQSRVQDIRNDELSWFCRAQILSAV